MLPGGRSLLNTTVILQPTYVTLRLDLKRQAVRSHNASRGQSDAPERRSQANYLWRANRRRPVIGDVAATNLLMRAIGEAAIPGGSIP